MRTKTAQTVLLTDQQNRPKFGDLLQLPEPFPFYSISSPTSTPTDEDQCSGYNNRSSPSVTCSPRWNATPSSSDASPYATPPWSQSQSASPYVNSPWLLRSPFDNGAIVSNGLIGSIVREEGHVYSLATSGDLLYTGSDSKNIRVWKNLREFSGFKASSGLVKAIVITGDRIFTGHTDGKIRVWRVSSGDPSVYKQVGSLPSLRDCITKSLSPKNYVQVRRNRSSLWIKHYDAVSCLSLNQDLGLLYSGSWDKTVKVWEIRKWRCLESIEAHEDAVNAVAAGFDSLVFTGSADGSLKVWRRELEGKGTKHFLVQVLLKQDKSVTSLAVNLEAAVVYCGSSDGLVNFWEREKYLSHGGVLRGHKQAVLCLATAGRLLLSGSADKSICVWRREEGGVHTCLTVLRGHSGPVKCLAVEEDDGDGEESSGWTVYSGSLDKSVKVWRVQDHKGMETFGFGGDEL